MAYAFELFGRHTFSNRPGSCRKSYVNRILAVALSSYSPHGPLILFFPPPLVFLRFVVPLLGHWPQLHRGLQCTVAWPGSKIQLKARHVEARRPVTSREGGAGSGPLVSGCVRLNPWFPGRIKSSSPCGVVTVHL